MIFLLDHSHQEEKKHQKMKRKLSSKQILRNTKKDKSRYELNRIATLASLKARQNLLVQ